MMKLFTPAFLIILSFLVPLFLSSGSTPVTISSVTTRILDLEKSNSLCIAHFDSTSRILIRVEKKLGYDTKNFDQPPTNPIQEYLGYEGDQISDKLDELYIENICNEESGIAIGQPGRPTKETKNILSTNW